MTALDVLAAIGVLPVVVIDDPADALPLGHALAEGGVPCAEMTLRTPAAIDAIRQLSALSGFTVGAGTVLDAAQLSASVQAGAQFVVSPGFDPELVRIAAAQGTAIVPGVATASEVMAARRAGLDVLKLFPAELLGGAATIAAWNGPFPEVRFVPSGGIDIRNAAEYRRPEVLSISTSWLAPRSIIAEGDFAEITRRTRSLLEAIGR
jgi:2-dehydro-3-deoxyphosphogluconate aldolase/(4S)-4-hydroxy-2-oxoglutarate aldolase